MTYEERIRDAYPGFSKSFTKLADFLLDSYLEAAFMTATELGHAIDVDATTVVRFSQQLGYSGYPELLREIREKIKSHLIAQPQNSTSMDSIEGVVETAMEELDSLFEQTRRLLDPDIVRRFVDAIGEAGKIVLLPDPIARTAAESLKSSLERGAFDVVLVEPGLFDLARSLRLVQKGDLFIAFQSVQESGPIAGALVEAGKKGASTAAVLGAASLDCAKVADFSLFAYAQPTIELTAMTLSALAYTMGQALRWRYSGRFVGADKAVNALAHKLRNHSQ